MVQPGVLDIIACILPGVKSQGILIALHTWQQHERVADIAVVCCGKTAGIGCFCCTSGNNAALADVAAHLDTSGTTHESGATVANLAKLQTSSQLEYGLMGLKQAYV